MHKETILSSETLFEGRIVSLRLCQVEQENGRTTTRELVEHRGGVCVLALDREDRVLMVRQYRLAAGRELLELPAGKLEAGEDPGEAGLRELEEETGHTARDYRPLGRVIPTPGYCTEVLHLYLARDLTTTKQNLDPGEFLTVESVPFEQLFRMCMSGEIEDAKTVVSVLKYAHLRAGSGQ